MTWATPIFFSNNGDNIGMIALSGTTTTGESLFYLTDDGTAQGISLFKTIISSFVSATRDSSNPIEFPLASIKEINGEPNPLSITVNCGNGINLAGDGNTFQIAPDGTVVNIFVIGELL